MIEDSRQLFPLCIVWTVIPCISWLFPTIGHTGICSSEGIIYDFMGFCVQKGQMGFGRPIKYVILEPQSIGQYDRALAQANQIFATQSHNLCGNNCHHHVADVLNRIKYQGRQDWTQVSIWWICIIKSSYVSFIGFLKVYLPFVIIVLFLIFIYMVIHHK